MTLDEYYARLYDERNGSGDVGKPTFNEMETNLLLAEQRIDIAVAIARSVNAQTRCDQVPPIHVINAIIAALTT